jgi:molecular chaperone Hsp33
MTDHLTDFVFPTLGARGAVVEITGGIADMLGWRDYAPAVRRILGQAIAATPLLASHSKFDGRINLQFQGKRAITLLVTQIDSQLQLRGMAKAPADAAGDYQQLMGRGTLGIMLEPKNGAQNYQALVEILGDSLAESLEIYFAHSEQLPTLLRLAVSETKLTGILLQRLPLGEIGSDDGNWEHLKVLFETLGEDELASTDASTILRRLFHAEDLRMLDSRPVTLACHCSHASISNMLLALGEEELQPVLKEFGKVDVTCEFCGRAHSYDTVQIKELFAAELGIRDITTKLN